jgi:uncharacterized 2Fe-2S/4Fe-4S cluster protein (DUF4445 family)
VAHAARVAATERPETFTMARVVFTPSGHDSDVAPGTTVLDAARQQGVDLDSVCGGRGICGRCAVTPSYGSFPKWAISSADGAFGAFTSLEAAYAERKGLPNGLRLGCQLHVTDDAVIDVPASSQVHRPVVRKTVDVGDLVIDPIIHLYYVVVEPAHLGDDRSASERLIEAVARDHGVAGVSVPLRLLPSTGVARSLRCGRDM